ncbi:hypothetical protein HGRIS_001786 [Hohenbuehelia grisea]|uniref:Uncharacterized protein n=1 Tax=Hohenbuehelia grisea TaxID=104357 RepID=A0ABR3JIG1_9AGAR
MSPEIYLHACLLRNLYHATRRKFGHPKFGIWKLVLWVLRHHKPRIVAENPIAIFIASRHFHLSSCRHRTPCTSVVPPNPSIYDSEFIRRLFPVDIYTRDVIGSASILLS